MNSDPFVTFKIHDGMYQVAVKKLLTTHTVIDNKTRYVLENEHRRIPPNTTLVGEIKQFLPISEGSPIQSGHVELKNGTVSSCLFLGKYFHKRVYVQVLSGIDSVILATGYRYSFPFLSQYYDGTALEPHTSSATTVPPFLPSDGSHIRNLYLDQFHLRDPTLAFLGGL